MNELLVIKPSIIPANGSLNSLAHLKLLLAEFKIEIRSINAKIMVNYADGRFQRRVRVTIAMENALNLY